ncbi:hypothetical protein Tco_0234159 [Tanacetum coccineum]
MTWSITGCCVPGPETIVHSSGIILLLRNVTVPPVTGNFSILWAVDGTAWIILTLSLPMISLYEDGDLTTMKFIHAEVECSSSPIFTSNVICPSGHIISPLNLTSGVAAGIIWLLTSERNLLKQCSYKISKEDPPSTYMRWTKCPPVSALIIIGPSVPSSSPRGGNEITVFEEKVWVILCLTIFYRQRLVLS